MNMQGQDHIRVKVT